jgi:all-trans-retinol 13,14-reductase
MKRNFDVIIIGSGMGGMAAGSLLSQLFKKRVLIIEKHFTFGGLTHEFARGEASFDVGVHLLGEMEDGSMGRKIFDVITGHQVPMQKMPAYYDKFFYPETQFNTDSDPEKFKRDLIRHFPEEAKSIRKYFKDVNSYAKLLTFVVARSAMPKILRPVMDLMEWLYAHLPNINIKKFTTTQGYLDRHFKSSKLKNILTSQWAYYGVTPVQSAMLMHAVVVNQY